MFSRPASFQDFLSRNDYIDEIYDDLTKHDTSKVVMKALYILRKTHMLQQQYTEGINVKTETNSTINRNVGNEFFKRGFYQKALVAYNQALLTAPKNSRAMKLAYSNRSALFYKLQLWEASYNDINRCFDLGCPSDIIEKLQKRKNDVQPKIILENYSKMVMSRAAEKCVNLAKMKANTLIPSISYDVKCVTTPLPKITASAYIKAGVVVASEKAHVSYTQTINASFSCHYCQKTELNLIPCDGCIYALFCNEGCKKKCMIEFHEYECQIMGPLRDFCFGPMPNLSVKASLKLRLSCKSWKEFIAASHKMGSDRIKSSSIQEVYDTNNQYSILCSTDKIFVYGVMYNSCFVLAAMMHYLEALCPSFFPQDAYQKQEAMQAFAKIMVFLSIHQKPDLIVQCQNNIKSDKSNYGLENYGLFPFISKLKNDCNPNILVVNNNSNLVLIALRPIQCGEELSISYLRHKYDPEQDVHVRQVKSFLFYGTVCTCNICNGKTQYDGELLMHQKKYFSKMDFNAIERQLANIEVVSVYDDLLKALTVLKDVPDSNEYRKIYLQFRRCIFFVEFVIGNNKILDNFI